ncbi:hypothetical protein PCASD_02283 [Puccinia coronata f. sp. avenae]|uniref:Alanine dehydrogenase/pyridine nucleotide transhydrogenase N-terminal domain-containing protein n=1 Tax=Puccinia coronata f. sp. avenae TaxID=200324 RepID=A0A2N5VI11_9BASI|nr:hypothetical protein PCASD_02283 [Puccinia coronata f. sp. avenae]
MRMIRGNALFAACSARRHHHHQHQYHHHHNYSATQLRAAGSVRPLHLHLAQGARRVTVAIRAEHPDRIWERRTPLVPDHVRLLIQSFPNQLTVNVESSQKRIFDDQSYANAGAQIVPAGTAEGDVVMAIKEIPIGEIPDRGAGPPRTYLFFSHTHKGQAYNVPLLQRMVASRHQFIDWELLVNPKTGAREVSFGRLAGVVGAGEALSGYGLSALKDGFSTPFLNLPRPYTFESTQQLFVGLELLRSRVHTEGYRGPILAVVVTGSTGRVGQGIVETLDHAGIQWARNLAEFRDQITRAESLEKHHKILGFKAKLDDYVVPQAADRAPVVFDRASYNTHPEQFRSVFRERVAPWTSVLINGAYWSSGVPRLLSNAQLAHLMKQPHPRLKGVSDISCDFHGGLEFVERATTIEAPYAYFKYDQSRDIVAESQWADGDAKLQLISIEILPSELAKDASEEFSGAIVPYVTALIQSQLEPEKITSPELLQRLENGTICARGSLMPQHQGLAPSLLLGSPPTSPGTASLSSCTQIELSPSPQKVVIFGSGLVAKPAIETLLQPPHIHVVIAAKVLQEAESLRHRIGANDPDKYARIEIVQLDAGSDRAGVSELVKEANIVISLLPATMHPLIGTACLEHSVHLITASYVSPAMAEMDSSARSRNLVFLNELGLDPGIDHMTAVSLIQRLKRDHPGARIRSFISFCGGLPERSDGFLGYRFSWSPRGVLEAAGNPAQFLLAGKKYEISGEKLLKRKFAGIGVGMFGGQFGEGNMALEGIANRDSVGYISRYGLDEQQLETMLRGTLRFEGFCEVMHVLKKIGLLAKAHPLRWGNAGPPTRWDQVLEHLGHKIKDGSRSMRVLTELGLLPGFGSPEVTPTDLPEFPSESQLSKMLPIDLLCGFLSHKLGYGKDERDMVLLSHEIRLETGDGDSRIMKSEMVARGDSENSAMSRTVGSPVGMGALVVLNHQHQIPKGVIRPIEEIIWKQILARLELDAHIRMVESQASLTQDTHLTPLNRGLEPILKSAIKKW